MKSLFLLLLLILSFAAEGQPRPDTMTGIFDERIKSLQIRLDGDDFAAPIAILNSDDRIRIDFDQLSDDREYFRYSLTHCNASWVPSQIVESEYLDGFNEGTVDDYRFSRATTVHYVHYSLTIPNEQMTPKLSGNYLLKIYDENDPDRTLLQCRFMISEDTAPARVVASPQTDIDYNDAHQQLSIAIDPSQSQVNDPFNDLIVVVNQNGRLDNEVALRQPLKVQGRNIIFEHQMPLIFDASNEYRRFEFLSETYPGMHVDDIEYHSPYYHYTLATDRRRDDEPYSYDQTQHGRFFIRQYNSTDSDVDADYGVVHFTLDYPDTQDALIFIDGDLCQRRFDPNSRMTFDPSTGLYHRAMLLKQGAYNYQYLIVPPDAKRGYTNRIEGDKYQTINQYDVRIYHRRPGERYDRLIGTARCRTSI